MTSLHDDPLGLSADDVDVFGFGPPVRTDDVDLVRARGDRDVVDRWIAEVAVADPDAARFEAASNRQPADRRRLDVDPFIGVFLDGHYLIQRIFRRDQTYFPAGREIEVVRCARRRNRAAAVDDRERIST